MYFAGLASWSWRVVARGFGVKTNKRAWSFMLLQNIFAEDFAVFEVFTIESKGEGKANGYRESQDRESSEGRRTSYRRVKPLS